MMEGWQEGDAWWEAGPRMLSPGLGTSPLRGGLDLSGEGSHPSRAEQGAHGRMGCAVWELGPMARSCTATGQRGPGNGATPRGGGGQPDHGRPHGITALTPTAGSGGQMGVPGRILRPGRCLRARRLVGRREQPFKGHRQRAALTTSAPHADSEKRESGSVIAARSVALPSAGS